MKKSLLIITVLIAFACSKTPDFAKVKIGMKSTEVVKMLGEPATKTPIFGGIVWWDYKTHMVVIDADTVVNCASKQELEKGFQDVSESLDSLGNKILEEADKTFKE